MRDNVKATKALVDEYLGARRNVFNDAGEQYVSPHPQKAMVQFCNLYDLSAKHGVRETPTNTTTKE